MSAKEVIEILGHHIYLITLDHVSEMSRAPDIGLSLYVFDVIVNGVKIRLGDSNQDQAQKARKKLIVAWKELRQ